MDFPTKIIILVNKYFYDAGFHDMIAVDCVNLDLSLTRDEISIIDWSDELVTKAMQQLRLRKKEDVFTSCVGPSQPIEMNTWLFLALKLNTFKALAAEGQLGKPTREAMEYLAEEVEQRLDGYEDFLTLHRPTEDFLKEEKRVLELVKEKMRRTLGAGTKNYSGRSFTGRKGRGKKNKAPSSSSSSPSADDEL